VSDQKQPLQNQRWPHLEDRYGKAGPQLPGSGNILIGLGANFPGPWGKPRKTLLHALRQLDSGNISVRAVSAFYKTEAIGQTQQAAYRNAVVLIDTSLPAPALLRRLKQIERAAGRRGGRPWGARTLDLDILDYKGLIVNWPKGHRHQRARPGSLVLPHALLHERPFVLRPLLDLAPNWRHPAFKVNAKALWERLANHKEGRILKRLS
jgi:2-amino-4-hydroxy-6-hydroxymethyldihydropteridine diphosphokinase